MKDILILNSDAVTCDFGPLESSNDECLVPILKKRKCNSPFRSPTAVQTDAIFLDTYELYKSNPSFCLYSSGKDQYSAESPYSKISKGLHCHRERSYPPVHSRSLIEFINISSLQHVLLKYESIDLSQFNNTEFVREVCWRGKMIFNAYI